MQASDPPGVRTGQSRPVTRRPEVTVNRPCSLPPVLSGQSPTYVAIVPLRRMPSAPSDPRAGRLRSRREESPTGSSGVRARGAVGALGAIGKASRGWERAGLRPGRGGGDPRVQRLTQFANLFHRGGLMRGGIRGRSGRTPLKFQFHPGLGRSPQPAPGVKMPVAGAGSLSQPDKQRGEGGNRAAGQQNLPGTGIGRHRDDGATDQTGEQHKRGRQPDHSLTTRGGGRSAGHGPYQQTHQQTGRAGRRGGASLCQKGTPTGLTRHDRQSIAVGGSRQAGPRSPKTPRRVSFSSNRLRGVRRGIRFTQPEPQHRDRPTCATREALEADDSL